MHIYNIQMTPSWTQNQCKAWESNVWRLMVTGAHTKHIKRAVFFKYRLPLLIQHLLIWICYMTDIFQDWRHLIKSIHNILLSLQQKRHIHSSDKYVGMHKWHKSISTCVCMYVCMYVYITMITNLCELLLHGHQHAMDVIS